MEGQERPANGPSTITNVCLMVQIALQLVILLFLVINTPRIAALAGNSQTVRSIASDTKAMRAALERGAPAAVEVELDTGE